MTSGAQALLVTFAEDFYTVDLVADALRARGITPVRINTDAFPQAAGCTSDLGDGERLVWNDTVLEPWRVVGVWDRLRLPARLAGDIDPKYLPLCRDESAQAVAGWLDAFTSSRWVNDPVASFRAQSKLAQLRLARAHGLATPPTLVTNSPDEVRAFRARHGPLVTKAQKILGFRTGDGLNEFRRVNTHRLEDRDLATLEGLSLCPMMFQPFVEKARELRIVIVDGEMFVGGITADEGSVDWRVDQSARFVEATVPAEVATRLQRLMEAFGLVAGSVDMIVTPAGEHVFLEVNAEGEWGMLQKELGLPIAEAYAHALARNAL